MKTKKTAVTAFITALCLLPSTAFAEENTGEMTESTDTEYTVTFTDFDGNVIQTAKVSPDEKIDYLSVDTSSLHSHIDIYTEQTFHMWSETPETIDKDTTIQALYKKATLSVDSLPTKREFYTAKGNLSLDGLSVNITLEFQTPEKDESGNFIVESEIKDITEICYAEVSDIETLFAEDKTATVNIIPSGDTKSLATYEITLFDELGDTNGDGFVDTVDASYTLQTYAILSTENNIQLNENEKKLIDVNRDGFVDSVDAAIMLLYYSISSTEGNPVWEEIVPALS